MRSRVRCVERVETDLSRERWRRKALHAYLRGWIYSKVVWSFSNVNVYIHVIRLNVYSVSLDYSTWSWEYSIKATGLFTKTWRETSICRWCPCRSLILFELLTNFRGPFWEETRAQGHSNQAESYSKITSRAHALLNTYTFVMIFRNKIYISVRYASNIYYTVYIHIEKLSILYTESLINEIGA